VFIDALRAQLV